MGSIWEVFILRLQIYNYQIWHSVMVLVDVAFPLREFVLRTHPCSAFSANQFLGAVSMCMDR